MTDKILVLTTTANEAEARKIAQALVERKLAACVNIVPRIQSVYRWKGEVESAEEYLLLIKTSETRSTEVQATLREMHSYELPECMMISIASGSTEYLEWLGNSLAGESEG